VVDGRLALAKELGATHAIDGSQVDPLAEILAATGRGADYALDTTAVDSAIEQAIDCTGPLGACGLIANKHSQQIAPVKILGTMLRGRTIRGIVQGDSIPDLFIPRLVDFHMEGRFPFDRLTKFYPFDDIDQALADADSGATIKPILRM